MAARVRHDAGNHHRHQALASQPGFKRCYLELVVGKSQHLLPKLVHVLDQPTRWLSAVDRQWFGKRADCGGADGHRGDLFGTHEAAEYEANTHGDTYCRDGRIRDSVDRLMHTTARMLDPNTRVPLPAAEPAAPVLGVPIVSTCNSKKFIHQ